MRRNNLPGAGCGGEYSRAGIGGDDQKNAGYTLGVPGIIISYSELNVDGANDFSRLRGSATINNDQL